MNEERQLLEKVAELLASSNARKKKLVCKQYSLFTFSCDHFWLGLLLRLWLFTILFHFIFLEALMQLLVYLHLLTSCNCFWCYRKQNRLICLGLKSGLLSF